MRITEGNTCQFHRVSVESFWTFSVWFLGNHCWPGHEKHHRSDLWGYCRYLWTMEVASSKSSPCYTKWLVNKRKKERKKQEHTKNRSFRGICIPVASHGIHAAREGKIKITWLDAIINRLAASLINTAIESAAIAAAATAADPRW